MQWFDNTFYIHSCPIFLTAGKWSNKETQSGTRSILATGQLSIVSSGIINKVADNCTDPNQYDDSGDNNSL